VRATDSQQHAPMMNDTPHCGNQWGVVSLRCPASLPLVVSGDNQQKFVRSEWTKLKMDLTAIGGIHVWCHAPNDIT